MVGLSFASSILVATSLFLLPTTMAEGGTRGYSSSSIVDVAIHNNILSDIEGQDCSKSRCGNPSWYFCKKEIGECADTTKSGVCTSYDDDMFCIQSLNKVCSCDGVVYVNSCYAYKNGKNVLCNLHPGSKLSLDDGCGLNDCANGNNGNGPPPEVQEEVSISAVVKVDDDKVVELMKKESTSIDPQSGSRGPQHTNRGPPMNSSSDQHHANRSTSEVDNFCDTGSGYEYSWSTPCESSKNFCSIPAGQCDIGEGSCQLKPTTCTMQHEPVCGCDRKTHGNKCMANGKGVNVWHDGECEGGNHCSDDKPCVNTDKYYCKFPPGLCGEDSNYQRNRPHLTCTEYGSHFSCMTLFKPVCGCDGKVYSNSCSAMSQNGVNVLGSLNPNDDTIVVGDSCDIGDLISEEISDLIVAGTE